MKSKNSLSLYLILIGDVLFVVGGILSYIFLGNIIICLLLIMSAGIYTFLIINSESAKKSALIRKRDEEFIVFISYFQSFIQNKCNVYTSFKRCMPYCSTWLQVALRTLLEDIDNDKSVQPYLTFSKKFTKSYVESTMLSIYQMVDEGEDSVYFNHFNSLFNQISLTNKIEQINQKQKSLDGMMVYPLIGAGLISILLTFGIISIMGELINVL